MNDLQVVANGQKIGPSMSKRSNCALVKIHRALQDAIILVEAEMEIRIERRRA